MKKMNLFKSVFFSSLFLCSVGLWSCSEDKMDEGNGGFSGENAVIELTSDPQTMFATSVELKLKASGVESFAYHIAEGEGIQAPLGEIIYNNALKEGGSGVTPITEQGKEVSVPVYGLEGGKTYTIFFAFKAGEDYVVEEVVVKTKEYSELLTLIAADKYKVKFHVAAGNSSYRIGFIPAEIYYATLAQGRTDVDMLEGGGLIAHKDTTIEISDGQLIDITNPDNGVYVVKPGSAFVVMAAQCDPESQEYRLKAGYEWNPGEDGGEGPDPWSRTVKPDFENYKEWEGDFTVASGGGVTDIKGNPYMLENEEVGLKTYIAGKVAKMNMWTEAFTEVSPSAMTITELAMNERTAKFSFVPGEGVVQYACGIMTSTDYDQMVNWVNEKGKIGYLLSSGIMQVANEPQELSISPMKEGVTYKLITIAAYDAEFNSVSYEVRDFAIKKSDKPAPKMQVTPLTLDPKNAYEVGFNVKCTSGDCASLKWAVNYVNEWGSSLDPNQGITAQSVIEQYGTLVTDPTILAAVNSDKGYDVIYSSVEDMASKIGLFGMNVDEKRSDVLTAIAVSNPATGERIESELFEKLKGTWTVTYDFKAIGTDKPTTKSFEMVVSDAPATISYNTWQDFKNAEPDNYATALTARMNHFGETEDVANANITNDIKVYKEGVERNKKKYRDQNRLVVTGNFIDERSYPFASAWQLYSEPSYTSYDIRELFYDFGPKMFLEIAKDKTGKDSLTLNVDATEKGVPPFSAWQSYTYKMMLLDEAGKSFLDPKALPVLWDEKEQTITITGYQVKMEDGSLVTFNPSVGFYAPMATSPSFKHQGLGSIVMKKGSQGPAPTRYYSNGELNVGEIAPVRSNGVARATRMPAKVTAKKQVSITPVSLSEVMKAKLEK